MVDQHGAAAMALSHRHSALSPSLPAAGAELLIQVNSLERIEIGAFVRETTESCMRSMTRRRLYE